MKLIAIVLSVLVLGNHAFADWGGILDGAATTKGAVYENCDIRVDFFINHANSSFEIAHLDYSCAMNDGTTLYHSFENVRMTIVQDQLLFNGMSVGTITDSQLSFSLPQRGGADFAFNLVEGTAAWDVTILDTTTGTQIQGRLW